MPKDDPYSYGGSRPGPKPGLVRRTKELKAAREFEEMTRGATVGRDQVSSELASAEFAFERQQRVSRGQPALSEERARGKKPKRRGY